MITVGQTFLAAAVAFVVTVMSIVVLRPVAIRNGWVDRPTARKRHIGEVPLVGGASVFLGMLAGAICYMHAMTGFELALFGTAATIAIIGAIDDRFDLNARFRVLVQILVILVMVKTSGVHIHTLGTYFGHNLALGWLGVPFTVMAVAGLLNAFNMMDGLDGLCGAMGLISIAFLSLQHGASTLFLACMMGAGLLPYLAFNLGLFGKRRKIFMGDAGSMTLGYIVAWGLIYTSQGVAQSIKPVTVLWFVAIPVMDMLTVMLSRILKGRSPLSPGRGHIHHMLKRMGLGPRKTLLVIIAAAVVLAGIGMLLGHVDPAISLGLFVLTAVTYAIVRIVALKAFDEIHVGLPAIAKIQVLGHRAANEAEVQARQALK